MAELHRLLRVSRHSRVLAVLRAQRGLTGVSWVSGLGLRHGFLEAAPSTGSQSSLPCTAMECIFRWPCPPRAVT